MYQDSAAIPGAYQYWGDIKDGKISLDRVKAGTYRLTIYATGESFGILIRLCIYILQVFLEIIPKIM